MTKPNYVAQPGDVVWLDFDPRTGHEQSGRRPCIILSDTLYTAKTGLAVVCPVTTKIKGLPYEIELAGLKTSGVILPIHVRSVDLFIRNPEYIETATAEILQKTRDYVRVIIGAIV